MEKKKNENKRIERKIPLFYLIGLNTALFLTIVAFEWKTAPTDLIDWQAVKTEFDPPIIIPPTTIEPPPLKPKKIVVVEVKNDPIDIPEDVVIDIDPPERIPSIDFVEDLPPVLVDDAPFILVEDMPKFPGGLEALYKFIGKKIKYPAQDRRMQIEGRVYVQFVVEKDGSLGEIEIVKGVSSTMDAETLRVVGQIPKFTPGKQRGRPVRVRMTIPVYFRLK